MQALKQILEITIPGNVQVCYFNEKENSLYYTDSGQGKISILNMSTKNSAQLRTKIHDVLDINIDKNLCYIDRIYRPNLFERVRYGDLPIILNKDGNSQVISNNYNYVYGSMRPGASKIALLGGNRLLIVGENMRKKIQANDVDYVEFVTENTVIWHKRGYLSVHNLTKNTTHSIPVPEIRTVCEYKEDKILIFPKGKVKIVDIQKMKEEKEIELPDTEYFVVYAKVIKHNTLITVDYSGNVRIYEII